MNLRQRKKAVLKRPWRRLVSATFLVEEGTGKTITKRAMLTVGIPVSRVEHLFESLPLVQGEGPG